MPRKPKNAPEEIGGQVNFKVPRGLWARMEATARALGLDMANFARMIVSENLYIYERRAKVAEQGPDAAD